MKLSELKQKLKKLDEVLFVTDNGSAVPKHFHITEVGNVTKHFIDCGGVIRLENVVSMQLWHANDTDHRLGASKLLKIIDLAEQKLGILDHDIEIEYQGDTIGKYGLDFVGDKFVLKNKLTNCLADDKCGIPPEKLKVNLANITVNNNACCSPNDKCC